MNKAKINEIFFSLQGEGPYQGVPQVFIRFSGCNMECVYCDTAHAYYKEYTADELISEIPRVDMHSISITGGEPLCQSDFLVEFLPGLNNRIYLETNGILSRELKLILPYTDIISMDFKFPSSTGEMSLWDEHREFLEIAREKEVFVKAVITDNTVVGDLQTALDIMDPFILLVLQPAGASVGKLLEFKKIALQKLKRAEIIPRMHKALGIK